MKTLIALLIFMASISTQARASNCVPYTERDAELDRPIVDLITRDEDRIKSENWHQRAVLRGRKLYCRGYVCMNSRIRGADYEGTKLIGVSSTLGFTPQGSDGNSQIICDRLKEELAAGSADEATTSPTVHTTHRRPAPPHRPRPRPRQSDYSEYYSERY